MPQVFLPSPCGFKMCSFWPATPLKSAHFLEPLALRLEG
jgi:hypothetical protein